MSLVTLESAELAYGHVPLLDRAALSIEAGERIALIGRNGCGKSSLLAVLAGRRSLDDGVVRTQTDVSIAQVDQEPDLLGDATAFAVVARGLADRYTDLLEYETLLARSADDPGALSGLHELEARLERSGAWSAHRKVDAMLARIGIDGRMQVASASGGTRKRLAIARALVAEPDLLLLDEPTNHLDIDAIDWLERILLEFRGAIVFVTHDRMFLDRVATRVIELDRGRLLSYPGNYAAYQARKAEQLEVESVVNAKFDKFLKAEEVWIRKGVEARRTRNEGRVRRLEALRRARAERRERTGSVRLAVDAGARSGKLVAEMEHVSHGWGGTPVISDLSFALMRGDKLGIVGPNGAGKTTLVRVLLGDIAPQQGKVRLGSNLQVAYFDQFRSALDDDATLVDTISPGSEWVEIAGPAGSTRRHVMTYLGDFLFPPERAHAKVGALSGGERARLLLARLFARPANLLVLDEPTNDLDIDTLELLEQLLQDYPGTVILVSHDRVFLDNVVTQVLVSEGAGRWTENPGGYGEWQAVLARRAAAAPQAQAVAARMPEPGAPSAPQAVRAKLSNRESRELAELPQRIAALESEQAALQARLAGPDIYVNAPSEVGPARARMDAIEEELMACLERWEALEARRR